MDSVGPSPFSPQQMSAHDSVIPESPPILENLQDGRPGPEERERDLWCLTHSGGAYRAKSEAKPPSACLQDGSLRELPHALSLSFSLALCAFDEAQQEEGRL